MSELLPTLRTISLFAQLDEKTLQRVAESVRRYDYPKGQIVFLEGEKSPGLYWLQSGWLKAVKQSVNGREQILQFFEPGNTFHEIAGFTDAANPATAIALDDVQVWIVPRETMLRLLQENPAFAQHVIASLAARIQTLVSLVEDLSLRPVIGRLARLILEDAIEDVLQRPRWYTQYELASRLGTVPDVVQRTLRGMAADGVIEVDRSQIRITDRERLEGMTDA
jgi:CRP/FNR family transcriptional regulator